MNKYTINEAAEILGISKEAVYNRIRRNTIKSIEEDGVKFVILNDDIGDRQSQDYSKKDSRYKNEFTDYLIKEIEELKDTIRKLQDDKDRLYREKEEILIASKEEIKTLYKERDEKLQYFLSFFEKPLLRRSETRQEKTDDITDDSEIFDVKSTYETNFDNVDIFSNMQSQNNTWQDISDFVNSLDIKRKKRIKIQSLLLNCIGKSDDIKLENNKILVNRNINLKELKAKYGNED